MVFECFTGTWWVRASYLSNLAQGYKRQDLLPWIIFLLTCRFMGLTAAFQESPFSASWAEKSFSLLPWRSHFCIPYKTLCAPVGPSASQFQQIFSFCSGKLQLPATLFQPPQGLLWSNETLWSAREQHLLPCKSESVVSCSGCCDKTRSRGCASRWCVSIRPWRGTAHIWCGLYLLPALLLDDCRLSSFCKFCTSSKATKLSVCLFKKCGI